MTKRRGFTLIELLVVIAIIALLMAILMPTLSRVRKQARAVACRANLGQWGIFYATYAAENDGHLPGWGDRPSNPDDPGWGWWGWGWWGPWAGGPDRAKSQWYETTKGIMCCPMATKPANPTDQGDPWGGTFLAWGYGVSPGPWWYGHGSYGISGWVGWWYWSSDPDWRKLGWSTTDVKDAATIPVLLDSCWPWGGWPWTDASWVPPAFDAVPTRPPGGASTWNTFCINRHDGYVNGLFLDWSVRKVGLKELWTLKWNKQYKTRGFWTKAGGVKPEDWPAWMRSFKDY